MTEIYTTPTIPGKYDIIPIHTSDMAAFLRCRRYWDWTSPARNNLRHKVKIFGVNTNLWFGSGIHYALEMHYNPMLRRDPIEAFLTWFNMQWEGGIVTEDLLEYSYDINPTAVITSEQELHATSGKSGNPHDIYRTWRVEGLRDMLPSADEAEFLAFRELGVGMLNFYKDYAQRNDDFEVIAAESTFSIPLGFEVRDIREQSPNYGQLLEVHARGKRDGIVYLPHINKYAIIDHKTAALINEEYFLKLEKDPQCSNYIWASQREAEMYDLSYTKIEYVLYNALRKAFPRPPTELKSGFPSLDRTNESTTPELFQAFVQQNGLELWYEDNEKAQSYYGYLMEIGDKQFIQRDYVRRNAHEVTATGEQIKLIAQDMLNSPSIYPAPSGSRMCTHCAFRAPCIAADDGSDWMGLLNDGYELNRDR